MKIIMSKELVEAFISFINALLSAFGQQEKHVSLSQVSKGYWASAVKVTREGDEFTFTCDSKTLLGELNIAKKILESQSALISTTVGAVVGLSKALPSIGKTIESITSAYRTEADKSVELLSRSLMRDMPVPYRRLKAGEGTERYPRHFKVEGEVWVPLLLSDSPELIEETLNAIYEARSHVSSLPPGGEAKIVNFKKLTEYYQSIDWETLTDEEYQSATDALQLKAYESLVGYGYKGERYW